MPRDLEGLSRDKQRERGAPSNHEETRRPDARDVDPSSVRGTISRSRGHDAESSGEMETERRGAFGFHNHGHGSEPENTHVPAREGSYRYNIRNDSHRYDDGEDIRRVFDEHRQQGRQRPKEPETDTSQHFTDSPDAGAPATDDFIRSRDTCEPTGAAKKHQRLKFTKEDAPPKQPGTVSEKAAAARRRADKAESKLERARDHLPKRHSLKIEKTFDEQKKKTKRRLVFEEEVKSKRAHLKGSPVTRPVKAGTRAVIYQAHRKIHEVEHENVGVEAGHKAEVAAEGGLRLASRRRKLAPYRKVEKLERKTVKLNAKAAYQKTLSDNPQAKKSLLSRAAQKRKIKRDYAKAARQAKKAAKRAKKTGSVVTDITKAVGGFIKRHPVAFTVILLIALLVILIVMVVSSFTNIAVDGAGTILATSYLAPDSDIDNAELAYTEWETDLQIEISRTEQTHPGYDEYRYSVDDIGHGPHELMAYLTTAYNDFSFSAIRGDLRGIFDQQYQLSYTETTETRTETRTVQAGESLGTVMTSGYCNCSVCCGQWAGGPTASGVMPTANHTIAVDANNPTIPMGTRIIMGGVEYKVEDTGNFHRYGVDFDIYFDDHATATNWGHRRLEAFLAEGNANSVEITTTRTVRILDVNLTALSFTDVIYPRLDAEQVQRYSLLTRVKGNRQYAGSPFSFNWLPYVSDGYGWRVHPVSGNKDNHRGVDIAVATGTEILAAHDGTVTFAGNNGNYGLVVFIEGEKGVQTRYAHCSQLLVSEGQNVKMGDVIAKVGSTGNSTGAHLHFEVLKDGQYLNPLYFAITNDDGSSYIPPGNPGGRPIPDYPGAPMDDARFAAMMEEAQKHLGKPYVFGASGPNSFDCSGFVSYVLKHSIYPGFGRTTAQGLYNICTPVSRANAQPGDLIFFTGTYNAGRPVTHIGIYIGNGQMIHAGKPIQYASIDTNYWTSHFYAFGRLP